MAPTPIFKREHPVITSREPLNLYGKLQSAIEGLRNARPLDLNAEVWRAANPEGTFDEWQRQARACLAEGLHYDPGPLDLRAETLDREEREDYVQERVAFNTTPWFRVEGYFLIPKGVPLPAPGLVVFHAWGGPLQFGKERIVRTGRDHPILVEHRDGYYSGAYLAETFVKAGYAVVVIDAFHFGERIPWGVGAVGEERDRFAQSIPEAVALNMAVREQLYLGVRQLGWAGTTWMGVNFWDDSRCVDYLQSRPEVDPERIGCTGLSGGGWRTDVMAALEPRVKASVSGCWMTVSDYQQRYNVAGCIGTFTILPGVWNRLDIPDLIVMGAPNAHMVINGRQDPMFPIEAQDEAARQIEAGFAWAGVPERARYLNPPKPHCYDAELQAAAVEWFDRHLGG